MYANTILLKVGDLIETFVLVSQSHPTPLLCRWILNENTMTRGDHVTSPHGFQIYVNIYEISCSLFYTCLPIYWLFIITFLLSNSLSMLCTTLLDNIIAMQHVLAQYYNITLCLFSVWHWYSVYVDFLPLMGPR